MVKLNNQFFEIILQGYRSPVNREGLKIGIWEILSLRGPWVQIPPPAPKHRLKLKKIIQKMIKQEPLLLS